MLDQLTLETFSSHVGSAFYLDGILDEPIELTLREANGLTRPPEATRTPYSLLFLGPTEPELPQQIFTLRHAQLEELSIFLVPLGPVKSGFQYEAVFT